MEQWRKSRAEVETCAARRKSLLPQDYVAPMLTGMSQAEENVMATVRELSGQGESLADGKSR